MFKKTSRAAAWVAPTTELAAPPAPVPGQRSEARGGALWALLPLLIRSGTCVALRVGNGVPMVALRAKGAPHRLEWVEAHNVLTASEAARWAKGQFTWR